MLNCKQNIFLSSNIKKINHSITMVLLDVDPQILLFLIFEQVSSEPK